MQRFTGVDLLASQFPNESPYNYVSNNPLRYTDPIGMEKEDWIDGKGNVMTAKQLEKVKVYIFYDNGKDGFTDQIKAQYDAHVKQYVKAGEALRNAKTEADFAQDWADICGNPDLIVMNLYGSDQAVHSF